MDSRILIIWGFSIAAMIIAVGLIIMSRRQRHRKFKRHSRSEPKIATLPTSLAASTYSEPVHLDSAEEPASEIDLLADESLEEEPDQHYRYKDDIVSEAKSDEIEPQEQPISRNGLITLYLHAEQDHDYSGYELLQALLSAHLRYGKMNIFHRHNLKNGTGDLLFSVASLVEPGHFNLDNIGAFSTPGLVLFFQANQVKEPVKVFELMLATADRIADDLGGVIHDHTDHPLTADRIQSLREHANQFESHTFDTSA